MQVFSDLVLPRSFNKRFSDPVTLSGGLCLRNWKHRVPFIQCVKTKTNCLFWFPLTEQDESGDADIIRDFRVFQGHRFSSDNTGHFTLSSPLSTSRLLGKRLTHWTDLHSKPQILVKWHGDKIFRIFHPHGTLWAELRIHWIFGLEMAHVFRFPWKEPRRSQPLNKVTWLENVS